jgi:hypothetical protein
MVGRTFRKEVDTRVDTCRSALPDRAIWVLKAMGLADNRSSRC